VILHTLWGSQVNYPFSLVLEAAWQVRHPESSIEVLADDDCLLVIPSDPDSFSTDELLSLVEPKEVEAILRHSMERSGFFGARFRENAARALLLPRSNLDRRIPLWLTRMRAKKLLEGVAGYGDFPILLETWRSCLLDEFDLPSLKLMLAELRQGQISRSETRTNVPSPFAENISWIQTNEHMYRSDGLPARDGSAVQEEVIREILYSAHLRPRIAPELAAQLQSKLQRTASGYSPAPGDELLDWLKERILVEDSEWQKLIAAVRRDHDPQGLDLEEMEDKLVRFRLPGAQTWMVSALEQMQRILLALASAIGGHPDDLIEQLEVDEKALSLDSPARIRGFIGSNDIGGEGAEPHLSALVAEWLRYYGPVPFTWISGCFGLTPARVQAVLDTLAESGTVVVDQLTRGASSLQVCDSENLEILLRLTRKGGRPSFAALNADRLPLFLAIQQGVMGTQRQRRGSAVADLRRILESLFGFPAPIRMWEEEIFPARLDPYYGSWLDELLRSSELQWFGCGRQRIAFSFASDLELFLESDDPPGAEELRRLLPSPRGKYSFWELADHTGSTPADTSRKIWELVWKGELACDSFDVLRKAAAGGFRLSLDQGGVNGAQPGSRRRGSGRRGYDRWRAAHPLSGSWFGIDSGTETDLVEEEELARDRVRQLLQRYGILFRELVSHELEPLQWSRIFRTLRLMELSGELLSGYFFEGVSGLQFISHRGFRILQAGLPEEEIYWICAADPASPCGLGLPISGLPPRLVSNHLVYHGSRLVLVSKRRGQEVELRTGPEDPSLLEYLRFYTIMLKRDVAPRKSIRVERINGVAARESPYKEMFLEYGFLEEYKGLVLRAGY
jgi:ATP-dependent Lhr-like helicase